MIKGVIFDIGGVIIDVRIKSFLEHFVRQTGLTKEQLYSMIVLGGEWEKFEKGLITDDQLKEKIEQDHGIKPEIMEKMADDWRKTLRVIPGTLEIIKKLRRHGGLKLFALSNVDELTAHECFERFGFFKYFDGVVLSCKVHMRKPETEIYEYVLKKMRLKPEEALFIDNYPVNLPPARELGINTILFTTPGKLKKSLRDYGVRI